MCVHDIRGMTGFTLLELMIVVSVLAISLLLVAPSFSNLLMDNRQLSAVYAMRATLNKARSEAITRRAPVVVCGSMDGLTCGGSKDWSNGYLAVLGQDDSVVVDENNPAALRLHWEARPNPQIRVLSGRDFIRFDPMGAALGNAGTLVFCDTRGPAEARGLVLSNAGVVRASQDSDDNGVVEDGDGNDVSCT